MRNCTIAGLLLLTGLVAAPALAIENNNAVAADMAQVIRESEYLSPARQDILIATVDAVLRKAEDVGPDRRAHAAEHLRVYLPDQAGAAEDMTDAQFAIINDVFRWSLGNYVAIDSITEKEREKGKAAVAGLKEGITKFVKTAYTDTPEEVRRQIADGALKKTLEKTGPEVGNYFYPSTVYPSHRPPSADEVAKSLADSPFLQNAGTRYARIAEMQADETLDKESRLGHIKIFANHEAIAVQAAVKSVSYKLFASRLMGYRAPSKKMLDDQVRLTKELGELWEKQYEEKTAARRKERQRTIPPDDEE